MSFSILSAILSIIQMPFKQRSNEDCKIILSKVLYFGMFCAIFALVSSGDSDLSGGIRLNSTAFGR
jgi:hypothetical protein